MAVHKEFHRSKEKELLRPKKATSKESLGKQVKKGSTRFEVLVGRPSRKMAHRSLFNQFLTDRDRKDAEMKRGSSARNRSKSKREQSRSR